MPGRGNVLIPERFRAENVNKEKIFQHCHGPKKDLVVHSGRIHAFSAGPAHAGHCP
jgi:hypothetical protein